jgi:meso-butanediol dehydrogenase/(S,S)-butanediol dehydrogenase/diacetyl reductase
MAECRRFEGKVAIVTGGASGIGAATARRLAEEGCRVAVVDLKTAQDLPPQAISIACDVSQEDQVEAAVKQTIDTWGRLDAVVNNAGLMVFKPITEHTKEDWLKILSVDLLGAFYFTKQAFLTMKPGGAIVNVSSIHAEETEPMVASYAAAKAALLSLTRSSALEGKAKGIRVNAILPGAVDTPMLWDNPNVKSGAEKIDKSDVGKPEDIAAVIAYLASDDAAFVQGAAVRADGGRLDRL